MPKHKAIGKALYASRLAALLLRHMRPACSLVAPGQPGASPPSVHKPIRNQTTSRLLKNSVKWDRQIDPGVLPCSQHR